jgi:hypothetical protein
MIFMPEASLKKKSLNATFIALISKKFGLLMLRIFDLLV